MPGYSPDIVALARAILKGTGLSNDAKIANEVLTDRHHLSYNRVG